MFFHGKTGKPYYSIRDKIKYYNKRAYNDSSVTAEQKAYALKRLGELKRWINSRIMSRALSLLMIKFSVTE